MKLKEVRTYQSVPFHTKQETHFNMLRVGMQDLDMRLDREMGLVSVKSSKDFLLIPLTNIAYILPAEQEQAKAKKQA